MLCNVRRHRKYTNILNKGWRYTTGPHKWKQSIIVTGDVELKQCDK